MTLSMQAKRVFENLCQFRLTYGDGESSFGCKDAGVDARLEKVDGGQAGHVEEML